MGWDLDYLRTRRIRSSDSLTTVSLVECLLCRSHIHIWPDLHPVAMSDPVLSGLQMEREMEAYSSHDGGGRRPQNTIGTVTCMEDMPHRYLWPCESRGGQETAVLTSLAFSQEMLLLQWRTRTNAREYTGNFNNSVQRITVLYQASIKKYSSKYSYWGFLIVSASYEKLSYLG